MFDLVAGYVEMLVRHPAKGQTLRDDLALLNRYINIL